MWAVAATALFAGAGDAGALDCAAPPPARAGGLAREEVTPVDQFGNDPRTAVLLVASTSLGADA
jgi:hypothetical protein